MDSGGFLEMCCTAPPPLGSGNLKMIDLELGDKQLRSAIRQIVGLPPGLAEPTQVTSLSGDAYMHGGVLVTMKATRRNLRARKAVDILALSLYILS